MNQLLRQFLLEGRDLLQSIGEKLIALESTPDSQELMTELFRAVHTLKGNSGLFQFPEMTHVLHACEDLMDAVRDHRVAYSQELADRLLEAMDFVSLLFDNIEKEGGLDPAQSEPAAKISSSLRDLIPAAEEARKERQAAGTLAAQDIILPAISDLPEEARLTAFRAAGDNGLHLIVYRPDKECFFKGEDPFFQARNVPGLLWGRAVARSAWPPLAKMDCYRCQLDFHVFSNAPRAEIVEYFRYVPDEVSITPISPMALVLPQGHQNEVPVSRDFIAEANRILESTANTGVGVLKALVQKQIELFPAGGWISSVLRWLLALIEVRPNEREAMRRLICSLKTFTAPDLSDLYADHGAAEPVPKASMGPVQSKLAEADRIRIDEIIDAQAEVLAQDDRVPWLSGRLESVGASLAACLSALGEDPIELEEALAEALEAKSARPLRDWLTTFREKRAPALAQQPAAMPDVVPRKEVQHPAEPSKVLQTPSFEHSSTSASEASEVKFGRRAEDALGSKVLKVDQAKIDRLMNLIGEMVVAKNALPYLADRAEKLYGVRKLSREIKTQYAVINRIAEEMQDAIMQVRMIPVSFVFQRFPRLVRDISRKLGKEVELVLQGEETEADKNIIEVLADPLIHIVRNSLDHGLETPDERIAAGKSPTGRLVLAARQESDRVFIEITDDGRGIDPVVVKRKAYEKGIIAEDRLDKISDQEAINLVFAAGFSTAEAVSEFSGRGVGLDVVRSALEKVRGSVQLTSEVGKGTRLTLTLPLSMVVTKVMIVESDRQIFGVPVELVVETVRVPRSEIRTIKKRQTTVLRGRIVPLITLNELLGIAAEPIANDDDEIATLVVKKGSEPVGILVDNFRETVDVILKPLPGELSKLSFYAGTAILGDGSVLMVLNLKELIR